MEEHVGYALVDRKLAAGLRADEGALLQVELEQGVVEAVKELGRLEHGGIGRFRELRVAHRLGGVDEGLPLDLVEHVPEEFGVELDGLLEDLVGLDDEREAIGYPLDVAGQHVVRQQPHLSYSKEGENRFLPEPLQPPCTGLRHRGRERTKP